MHFSITLWLNMASILGIARAPRCISCLYRILGAEFFEPVSSFRVQLRGKKKSSRQPATVKAKLLRDIRGWGPKGRLKDGLGGTTENLLTLSSEM